MWKLALILRVIFLAVPFDIYFTSPLVRSDAEPSFPDSSVGTGSAPADRLVLFVADGFRIRSFLDTDNAPYLKGLVEGRGSSATSHTRIPTESRPGHVAIAGGFYEDPSAILRGWRENPIEFDSVFNRSRRTWSWGSPTILPMFERGAAGGRVVADCYSREEEDFSGATDTRRLDEWVFDRVRKFFAKAHRDATLADRLKQNKLVFFLHLLGLDTSGHTHKPGSSQYEENIKTVDEGVKEIVNIFESYFDDGKTSFVFTADHGMTDWGSHGAGSDDETKTPFIAWGAGIALPNAKNTLNSTDIEQADICPLMASLIGIDFPVDSVGSLHDEFLDVSEKDKTLFYYSNMRQILKQYNTKRESVENNSIELFFKPFEGLTETKIWEVIVLVEKFINEKKYEEVKNICREVIRLSLSGLEYYQNYYQSPLLLSMTLSYFGWIFWLLGILLKSSQNIDSVKTQKLIRLNNFTNYISIATFILVVLLCFAQNLPLQYYLYFSLPIFLWWQASAYWSNWIKFIRANVANRDKYMIWKRMCLLVLYLAGVVILVTTFFHRWALSIALAGVALFPLMKAYRRHLPVYLLAAWIVSCALLAVFSFLPVIGKQNDIHLVGIAGLFWFVMTMFFVFNFSLTMLKSGRESKRESVVMVVPPILTLVAIQIKYFVSFKFHLNQGLPLLCQILSWALAVASLLVPLLSSRWMISRLYCIKSSLAIFFLLLSVSHESLFLLTLSINLFSWLIIEQKTSGIHKNLQLQNYSFSEPSKDIRKIMGVDRILNPDDFRRAFIFLLYIILSFFGTGNIASLNSFDPQWIRCFITQFSPFSMAALLVSKTLIPFLSVVCAFCGVNSVVKAPTGHLILIVLVFSDLMGLVFLHLVTNKGSWLDIGTSISHYIIMELTVLFVSVLYGIGHFMTGTYLWNVVGTKDGRKKI